METITFSIIIPMYNVGKLLARSISSVRAQDYQNYEVVCVDDGSTDNTVEIAKELIGDDTRFRIIQSEHIGRASAMRNVGVRDAQNAYIVFLDADDEITVDALGKIAAALKKNGEPDVLMGHADVGVVTGDGAFVTESHIGNFKDGDVFKSGIDVLLHCICKRITLSCYGCLNIYRRDLLVKNKLFQSEDILFLEDHDWLPKVLYKAGGVGVLGDPFYHYIRRGDSITLSFTENSLHDVLKVVVSAGSFIRENEKELSSELKRFWANHVLSAFYWFFFQGMYKEKVSDATRRKVLIGFFKDTEKRALFNRLSNMSPKVKRYLGKLVQWARWGICFPAFWAIRGVYFPMLRRRLKRGANGN